MRPNFLLWLSSFVVIAASFCIILSLPPQPDQASWQQYTNPTLGFSVEYPPDWFTKQDGQTVYFFPKKDTTTPKPSYDYLQVYVFITERFPLPNIEFKPTKINGLDVLQTDKEPSAYGLLSYLFPTSSGKYLEINFSPYDPTNPSTVQKDNLQVFNRLVSSFKFVTTTPTPPEQKIPLIQIGKPTPSSGCYYLQVQCITAPCDPVLMCPETSPTCRPRPGCLDQEPRCLMPETEDMCPPSTDYQETVY